MPLADLVEATEAKAESGPLANAESELHRHCETVESWEREAKGEEDDEDPWVFAAPNESLESFLAGYPPSSTEKAWISTDHDGRKKMIEDYYTKSSGVEGEADKAKLAADWEKVTKKSTETLTATLKEHKYGCGKWMIFAAASDVDAMWGKIVSALWDGKLGHTAKVSGAPSDPSKSHVICVYVDPFWEREEMERVLHSLRTICGVNDTIKFKPDGLTLLNIYKDNEYGIPPSFFSSSRGSLSLSVQSTDTRRWCKNGADCKHLKQGRCSYLHKEEDFVKEVPKWRQVDADGMQMQRPSGRAPPAFVPKAPPAPPKPPPSKASVFAALSGFDDDDSEAILEKKRKKKEKKAAKKAEEEARIAAESAANFAAIKDGIGAGGAWGDEEDEEELPPPLSSTTVDADEDDDDEEEEEEVEEEEEEIQGEEKENTDTPAQPTFEKKKKKEAPVSKEQEEVDKLLAALEEEKAAKEAGAKEEEGGQSKAAAKRAKKKAEEAAKKKAAEEAAAEANDASVNGASTTASGDDKEQEVVPKTAEEIRQMMKARAEAAAKKKSAGKASDAAALVAAENKKREAAGGKKKKQGPTYQVSGPVRGQKARGSDNKYQGE